MSAPPRRPDAISEHFNRLMRELDSDSGDRPATNDETGYFNLIDLAANDPETDPAILDEAGNRFAEHFVAPYLHASDPSVLITEIAALFEIHHRGRIHVENMEPAANGIDAVIQFNRIAEHGEAAPTRFDVAVMRRALLLRDRHAAIEELESDDQHTGRYRIRLSR